MVLDKLAETRVNIKDLVLDEPTRRESNLHFDPERDITHETWSKLDEFLEKQKSETPSYFLEGATALKLISPKRLQRYNLGQEEIDELTNSLDKFQIIAGGLNYMPTVVIFKTLFPDQFKQVELPRQDWIWGSAKRTLDTYRDYFTQGLSEWRKFPEFATTLKIAFPEHFQDEIDLEDTYEEMKSKLEQPDSGELFVSLAAQMKILFPDKGSELQISDDRWETIKHWFNDYQRRFNSGQGGIEYLRMLSVCQDMMILQAQEVQITDQGLNLIMPQANKPFTEFTPSIPEVRKF